jgi:hypothetical protein
MSKSIRKLSAKETDKLKEKIVVRGRPYNRKLLDVATIDSLELLPTYQIETGEQRKVYVSAPYKKSGYVAFVGYIEDGDNLVARTFFYSRSEGVARLLRRYKFEEVINEEGERKDKITWNDKGYSEKSIALPIPLQKGLATILASYMKIDIEDGLNKPILKKVGGNVFYGTAYDVSKEDDYIKEISKEPLKLKGNFYGAHKQGLVVPTDMIFSDEKEGPRFDNPIDSYSVYLEYYGMTQVDIFKSKDSNFIYLFNTDEKGRTWIGQIDNMSEITSLGIRSRWVDSGCLTTPAWEYLVDNIDQTGGYGDESNRFNSYVDMYKKYISHVPVVREYVAHKRASSLL